MLEPKQFINHHIFCFFLQNGRGNNIQTWIKLHKDSYGSVTSFPEKCQENGPIRERLIDTSNTHNIHCIWPNTILAWYRHFNQNLVGTKKDIFIVKGAWPPLIMQPTMVHSKAFDIITWQWPPPSGGYPLLNTLDVMINSVVFSPGNLHQYPVLSCGKHLYDYHMFKHDCTMFFSQEIIWK
jgi:hypothetical protein